MTSPYFPYCCSKPARLWQLPTLPAQAELMGCTFNPAHWTAEQSLLAGALAVKGAAKRQIEFLAGRLCAREGLYALTGQSWMVGKDLSGAPVWPADVVGSITHSQHQALALVAPKTELKGVGIDLEGLLSQARAEHLAERIHPPAEYARRQALPPEERAFYSTLSFSLKESLFKALYPLVERRFYFHDAELLSYEPDGHASLILTCDLSAEWRAGVRLSGQFVLKQSLLLSAVFIAQP